MSVLHSVSNKLDINYNIVASQLHSGYSGSTGARGAVAFWHHIHSSFSGAAASLEHRKQLLHVLQGSCFMYYKKEVAPHAPAEPLSVFRERVAVCICLLLSLFN